MYSRLGVRIFYAVCGCGVLVAGCGCGCGFFTRCAVAVCWLRGAGAVADCLRSVRSAGAGAGLGCGVRRRYASVGAGAEV